ncbi:MAG: hypothetical protein CFH22_00948 [Alphaproteobacteria bacterium MarineAlpha5_Bin12]|nr:hypothetical protein [Candidatus Neomarinimicrobiota bacterium]PPR41264.1 MAG: hypothetical protein CFH22_00948 [Alphaproteobacteria bacterium MarineAlpha5_Bin12]|tara:strand:- start:896 stop:1849 length:954 start_codon:yes stop_codon:yes gene_type:complete
MMKKNNNTLEKISIGTLKTYKNLSVFPIIGENIKQNITHFTKALNENNLKITEISDEGYVPEVEVENFHTTPIFIIDGQTIAGFELKQNRIATVSSIIPGITKMKLNVLCSEKGRWSRTSRQFASRNSSMFAKGRFAKMEKMQKNIDEDISSNYNEAADQEQTWEQINKKFNSFDTYSSSESMQDLYKNNELLMENYLKHLTMPEDAIGVIFAIGKNILGFELFSNKNIFQSLYPQILKSYALDEMENRKRDNLIPTIKDANNIIFNANNSIAKQCKNSGLGQLFTINNKDICATILMLDETIIHFSCFSKKMQEEL